MNLARDIKQLKEIMIMEVGLHSAGHELHGIQKLGGRGIREEGQGTGHPLGFNQHPK